MQGGRRKGDISSFEDRFGGLGGFGLGRSFMSNFFQSDPFDDPFFRSSGSMLGFDGFFRDPFRGRGSSIEQKECKVSQSNRKELVIEELPEEHKDAFGMYNNSSQEPIVEDPDDDEDEGHENHRQDKSKSQRRCTYQSSHNLFSAPPQSQTYSFQSSSVTYGGINGAYYTSSTTRRTGADGVMEEEHMEADTTTGNATKRISRGIGDKGHSVTKKLTSYGKVDTMEALHNLNEDEVTQFDEDWERLAQQTLPGWNRNSIYGLDSAHTGTRSTRENGGKLALPSTEQEQATGKEGKQSAKNRKWFGLRRA